MFYLFRASMHAAHTFTNRPSAMITLIRIQLCR